MKIFKPLMLAALAGLPLSVLPAMAQSSMGSTTNSNGAAYSSPAQSPTPQQQPAAQGGTNGSGAGESGGSGKK